LFDSGEADGLLFYVMPYVEGETLRDRMEREGQLPVADALAIAVEVADALSFAHGRGIVHRDIKPENILLEAGHAVVADFGIAKALTIAASEDLTNIGFAVGTPKYMSPEQAAADPSLDGRSDLYSLGCVLFEMLAGQPPFTASSPGALLARKLVETAPRLGAVRSNIPEGIEIAVGRCLRRVPADRYTTMLEFADALESADRGESIALRTSTMPGIAGKDLGRLPIEIRPLDAELDVYGLTHPGKVQRVNQDHFVMCSIRRDMHFHLTSLPDVSNVPRKSERRAFISIIADGIGRDEWGEQASRTAMEVVTQQLMHSVANYSVATDYDEQRFINSLYSLAVQCQLSVEERNWANSQARGSAFGMTIWIGMWPKGYVVEIGPSRIYRLDGNDFYRLSAFTELDEETRQRHMQATKTEIVTPPDAARVGAAGAHYAPVVYRHEQRWGLVGLMCTRGLTDHVPEHRIAERLRDATSSKQACETLLEDALAAGGAENITVVVGRSQPIQS
jgi:serine/threonine protein kinase